MYISIDLGGTSTRVASSKDLISLHKLERFPTNKELVVEKKLLNNAIAKVIEGETVDFVCVGVPGMVDRYARTFEKIVNYPELTGKSYEVLFDITIPNSKIVIENDAALAGLAESRRGVAAKFRVLAYLTLSTGFGGVRIQDKQISRIQGNFEPGHMIIVEDGREDSVCGQKGCAHSYLSGVAFKEIYGMEPFDCKDPKVWNEYGEKMATVITNVVAMWDPGVIVLGGSIATRFEMFEPAMHDALYTQSLFDMPKILKSEMGDVNGVWGGFDLISQIQNS